MTSPLRDGWGYDYATGKPLDMRKPEERVRQDYERSLHLDYGYDLARMDIEVRIQRGEQSGKRNARERADLVIYRSPDPKERNQFSDVVGVVETKRPNRADGVRQLLSYMTATSAQWGVWVNGLDIEHVYRDPVSGEPKVGVIFDIPRSGESVERIGRLSKDDLIPAQSHSLKPIFSRALNMIYTNAYISRREKLGSEMIRLIFAKIWDERFHMDNVPEFRVGLDEDPERVKERVVRLFEQVKEELVEDGVFEEFDTINLDARSVAWVVGQLEQYSLLKTDKDVVGDAFEVFAESKFAGETGEFFTPREVVRTAVEIVNPQPGQRILDPACGSGGFLIYALEHVWNAMENNARYRNSPNLMMEKQEIARRCFFGIDKELDLVKIAKAYMAIVGDGRGGIAHQNSLNSPSEFQGRAREMFVAGANFREFDLIFTNPPFGVDIKVPKDEAAQFALGRKWEAKGAGYEQTDLPKDTEPQILFVERCFQMLRDGGVLAIVLPESFFHAVSYRYILQFITKGNNVKAVVDLPHNTFRPHNNAKTCLLVVQKGVDQQADVVMAVAEQMGHDHNGNPLFRFDSSGQNTTEEIWDDLAAIRKELAAPYDESNRYTFVVRSSDVKDGVYVPRYYWRRTLSAAPSAATPVSIQQLLDEGVIREFHGHGSPPAKYKGMGDIPYIRVADIVNWEMYRNPTTGVPRHVYERVKGRAGLTLEPRDVVFVRRGSYRIGTVAMASPYDTEVLLTRELVVLRVAEPDNAYDLDAYYLLYLLSHQYTQEQMKQKIFIDTTLPDIASRWKELLLPVADDPASRISIRSRVKAAIDAKWDALDDLNALRLDFGDITT